MTIYYGNTKVTGNGVQVDTALSSTSTHAVTNKAITEGLIDVGYSEWQKPADWIDIRSGALPNSVYFLVGHKADYSQYAKFSFKARTSSSGTYDVFVDGVKKATTAHNTDTVLDWQTLALTSGWDVTTPTALRTHIVRVTPTSSSETLDSVVLRGITGQQENGLLWAHYQLSNAIYINGAYGLDDNTIKSFLLQAITAKDDKITYTVTSNPNASGLYCTFFNCKSLVKIPVLVASTNTYKTGDYATFWGSTIKKAVIKNNNGTERLLIINKSALEKIDVENGLSLTTAASVPASDATALKQLPAFTLDKGEVVISQNLKSLQNTFIDDSFNDTRKLFRFYGTSANFVSGLKGVVVSNEAPFDNATAPQLDVSYTGLDRAALVNLFNSMPYNVGYETVGSPTITNGVVSGFSGSDYLTLPTIFSGKTELDVEFAFKLESDITAYVPLLQTQGYGMILCVTSERKIGAYLSFDGTSWGVTPSNFVGSTTIALNSSYSAMLKKTATAYELWLKSSGGSWNLEASLSNSDTLVSGSIRIGHGARPFPGSIDLNNTHININGVPWFRGTAAMTKTCDVRGCTGTADLTQTDKDIALNKGWSLTVA